MKLCDPAQGGVATRQMVLSQQQLRELLGALTKAPAVVVLQVGYVLRLVEAVTISGLSTGDAIGGNEGRVRLGAASKVRDPRRAVRAVASTRAPAARRRLSLSSEDMKQAAATIAAAFNQQAKREEPLGGNGGLAAEPSGEQAIHLRSWATKAKRTVPLLMGLLESGATKIRIEHAILVRSHVEGIPVEKAARALSAAAATLRFITSTADGILQHHSPGASETLSAAIASGGEIENEASLTITEVRAATEERSAATVQAFARRVLKRVKLQRAAAVAVQARWRGASVRARLATVVETRTGAQAAEEESSAVPLQALARGMLVRAGLRSEVVTAAVVQGAMRGMQARLHEERSRAAVCSAVMTASSEGRRSGEVEEGKGRANAEEGDKTDKMLLRTTFTRWMRAQVDRSAARAAAAEAQQVDLQQRVIIYLQAGFRGHRARTALRREAQAAIAVQARWRGTLGRALATARKTSVVGVQAFARGSVVAAWYRKARVAVAVLQARWRGVAVRQRLAPEAEIRAAVRRAMGYSNVPTFLGDTSKYEEARRAVESALEAFAAEKDAEGAAAVVVQKAWRTRQARLEGDRSHAVARAAALMQLWSRKVDSGAEAHLAREGKKDNKEEDKEEEEQKPTKAAQVEAAQRELLQYMQGMPFRSIWWMTKEGAKMKEHVEDMHRQLANRMAEECRRVAEVGDVLLLEEVTAETTTSATRNITSTDTPPPSGGRSPTIEHATTTAAGTPRSPARRRRRSSTGSRSRSRSRSPSRSPPPVSTAWPPSRSASPPRDAKDSCVLPSGPSPPASPGPLGTSGGGHPPYHRRTGDAPPRAGGLGCISPTAVSTPGGFAAASEETPQQRKRQEHPSPPPPVQPDGPRRTIQSCLTAEAEWYPLCQDGLHRFTRAQEEWATLMIAKVCDSIGAPTEILVLAVMTLGASFGDPAILETSLRPDDLFLVPAACVLDAACRNPTVFRFTPETVIDTMVSVIAAAKGNGGDEEKSSTEEADANDAKARLVELRGMIEAAVQDGSHWAGPFELIKELIRRSGVPHTKKTIKGIRAGTEAIIRSAVLDGALGEFPPSHLACSAFYGATNIMISFEEAGVAGGSDDEEDSEDNGGSFNDPVEEGAGGRN